jgi:hypothetical protein
MSIPGLLLPLAHGVGRGPQGPAPFVISPAPPGPSLAGEPWPWSESELMDQLLRPVALALDALQATGQTHRAIRPDNVFRAGPGAPVVLGSAWAAPAASLQPAAFEPPYVAMCLPHGRGDGSIADDVYALGVLLLTLALGRAPCEGLDTAAIVGRKLAQGSYAALVGGARLPPGLADLIRGMLAEDPEHRPPPLLLTDPPAARARRVAVRPPRRAPMPLALGEAPIWDARSLSCAIATMPDAGLRLLRSGGIDQWLRRGLGDTATATRVDELIRHRDAEAPDADPIADATLVMRVVATFDPLAPLCWRGVAIWPDGVGPALAEARVEAPAVAATLIELLAVEAIASWAAMRPERCNEGRLRAQARQGRTLLQGRGVASLNRLCYALNPLLPCGSPLVRTHCVTELAMLLPALESIAGERDRPAGGRVDADIHAYVGGRMEANAGIGRGPSKPGAAAIPPLEQVRMIARLQALGHAPALPKLTAWLAELAGGDLSEWHGRRLRDQMAARLQQAAQSGRCERLLAALDDTGARQADAAGLSSAQAEVARIDAEISAITEGGGARAEVARQLGHEIATMMAMAALVAALLAALLG